MINNDFGLKNKGFSNFEGTAVLPRQRWYYYKEGFSSKLIELAANQLELDENDYILDPFNGSGTTTLTAATLGINSMGVEVNPFTSFLSEAKLATCTSSELNESIKNVEAGIIKGKKSLLEGFSTFSKTRKSKKWLFNTSVLRSFEGGWQESLQIDTPSVRNVIQIALIAAAMDNCNARKDGKGLKYRANWKSLNFQKEDFIETFQGKIIQIGEDLDSNQILSGSTIVNCDARSYMKEKEFDKPFSLCITSPPYLNTFDYTDIYRPELFLGKFINSQDELAMLRAKTLRSHVHGAKWDLPIDNDFGPLYQAAISHVKANPEKLMDKAIPLMIQAYFEDMKELLTNLKSRANKNAEIWIVVANSAYADKEIPVDLIIGNIGSEIGLYLKEVGVLRHIKRRKTRHSPNVKYLRESVIIFTASK